MCVCVVGGVFLVLVRVGRAAGQRLAPFRAWAFGALDSRV